MPKFHTQDLCQQDPENWNKNTLFQTWDRNEVRIDCIKGLNIRTIHFRRRHYHGKNQKLTKMLIDTTEKCLNWWRGCQKSGKNYWRLLWMVPSNSVSAISPSLICSSLGLRSKMLSNMDAQVSIALHKSSIFCNFANNILSIWAILCWKDPNLFMFYEKSDLFSLNFQEETPKKLDC